MITWSMAELLPHAGNAILLDQVVAHDDNHIETTLTVSANGLYNQADGSLPGWLGVEIMAQAVAAYAGCRARTSGLPVELGFLLGTRNYQCNVQSFPLGSQLHVSATRSLEDESGMGVFECEIAGHNIQVQARLNVYRPPQAAQYLQETPP